MKQLSFLSLILLSFCLLCFSSCKKNEELSTRDKIIGKWDYTSVKYEKYGNGELVNSGSDVITGLTIEFKEDDTYVYTSNEDGTIDTDTGVWELEGNSIVVNEEPATIKEITEQTMLLIFEDEYTEDGVIYRQIDEISLTKQ